MRTSEKAVSESETAAVTASRLTFYRSLNDIFSQMNLSADSISLIFQEAASTEFPTAFSSRIESLSETPSDSLLLSNPNSSQRGAGASRPTLASRSSKVPSSWQSPKSLTIYGLHLAASSEEKSVSATDLRDSVATATQSHNKSAVKQNTAPIPTFRWLPMMLTIVCISLAIILIRYIHRHISLRLLIKSILKI